MANRWSYPRVEGLLYGLAGQPDARVPTSRFSSPTVVSTPGPRGPFPETVNRLDVAIAARSLDPQDREVLTAHYLKGARVPKRARRRAVKKLVVLLGDLDA